MEFDWLNFNMTENCGQELEGKCLLLDLFYKKQREEFIFRFFSFTFHILLLIKIKYCNINLNIKKICYNLELILVIKSKVIF